jgi:hypothetical protein
MSFGLVVSGQWNLRSRQKGSLLSLPSSRSCLMTCLPVSETLKMNIVNPLQEETMGLLKTFPTPWNIWKEDWELEDSRICSLWHGKCYDSSSAWAGNFLIKSSLPEMFHSWSYVREHYLLMCCVWSATSFNLVLWELSFCKVGNCKQWAQEMGFHFSWKQVGNIADLFDLVRSAKAYKTDK